MCLLLQPDYMYYWAHSQPIYQTDAVPGRLPPVAWPPPPTHAPEQEAEGQIIITDQDTTSEKEKKGMIHSFLPKNWIEVL